MASSTSEIEVEGRTLRVSNLDKILYPQTGFTKGQVIDYYRSIAPVVLPHLRGRPLTLKRYPNGVEGDFFYEKQCPKHKPEWLRTVGIEGSRRVTNYCVVDDGAALAWMANLASLELHPLLAIEDDLACPTKLTFDLDPGAPATITECCAVALELRDLFTQLGLQSFPKTSGSKGMQIEVPLDGRSDFDQTKEFAHAVARLMEKQHPDRVVSRMEKAVRDGKVFIDWSQNHSTKTTVCVYSLRARPTPTVSTPVTWDEVAGGAGGAPLSFEADDVVQRMEQLGDLHAPVAELKQPLPKFSS